MINIKLVKSIIPNKDDVLVDYGKFENENEVLKIAEKEFNNKVYYYRKIIISDKSYTVDYGSHCNFLLVEVLSE
jgi:hypothetical protein